MPWGLGEALLQALTGAPHSSFGAQNMVKEITSCTLVTEYGSLLLGEVHEGRRRWQTFSEKVQIVNTFSFAGHRVLVTTIQLCHRSPKAVQTTYK